MFEEKAKQVSYKEELVLFYNKYLFLELGEGYLPALVDKFTKLWKKENQLITSTEKNFKLTLEDYLSLSKLDQDFLTFVHHPVINVNDDYQLITDEYGLIKGFLWKRDISDIEVQELEQNI